MPREKFNVGETAEINCTYLENNKRVTGWLTGTVVEADYRMAAVKFRTDVFSSNGWLIPDRVLWCAHGSPNIRRPKGSTN